MKMTRIRTIIDCKQCNSKNSICDSDFKAGVEEISCNECGLHLKLLYRRDEYGNYNWKNKPMDLEKNDRVTVLNLREYSYATYMIIYTQVIEKIITGNLDFETSADNFILYIHSILNRKHSLKSVTVFRYLDETGDEEIIFQYKK